MGIQLNSYQLVPQQIIEPRIRLNPLLRYVALCIKQSNYHNFDYIRCQKLILENPVRRRPERNCKHSDHCCRVCMIHMQEISAV